MKEDHSVKEDHSMNENDSMKENRGVKEIGLHEPREGPPPKSPEKVS